MNTEEVLQIYQRDYTIETWMYWTTVPFANAEIGGTGSSQLLWAGQNATLQIVGSGDEVDSSKDGIGADLTVRPGDGTVYGASGELRPKAGGQWYHVAYQRKGSNQLLHVEGQPVAVKWEGGPPTRYSIQNRIIFDPFALIGEQAEELSELQFILNASTNRGVVSAAMGQVRITARARYGSLPFRPPLKTFFAVRK